MESRIRFGREISSLAGAAASNRSSKRSVSAAAALSLAGNDAFAAARDWAGRDLELRDLGLRGMGRIVLNLVAMTSSGSSRSTVFRVVRGLIVAMVVLLPLPYLLTPLYRVIDPVSTLMLARWVTGKRVERAIVPLEQIAPILPRTVIASEDARFCRHSGIDWEVIRAAIEDADG